MQPRARALVLLVLLGAVVPSARAEDDELRSSVVRFAEAQWGDCSRQAVQSGVVDDRIEVELVSVRPRHALAIVRTPCQRALDGAYNGVSELVEVRGRDVTLVAIAPDSDAAEGELWNAMLRRVADNVELVTSLRLRAIGDSGWQMTYRWNGTGFVVVERRSREGGAHASRDVGPYPIVEPSVRACFPQIEVVAADRARLRAVRPGGERSIDVELHDPGCAAFTRDTLLCERRIEYGVVARADHWLLLRLDGDGEREVARMPRGCAL